MARASSTRSGASSSASPRETARARRALVARRHRRARRRRLQLRGARARAAASAGLVPEGEAAHLQRLLRGAHASRAARPASYDDGRRRALRRPASSTSTSARVALEVCEDIWSPDGPMRRRCYAGAELVVNVSASPFRLGVVDDAARDDRHARRRQPGDGRLREPRRRQRRPRLRRRRLRRPERPPGARGAALPRGRSRRSTVDLDRTRRLRAENTTWRTDQEAFAAHARRACAACAVDEPTARARAARATRCRRTGASSCPPPSAPRPRARRVLRGAARRARARRRRLLREDRRVQDHRRRALGRARQPARACSSRAATSTGASPTLDDAGAPREGARDAARLLHADALLVGGDARAPPSRRPRELGVPLAIVSIDDAFERELEAVEKMLQPGEALTPLARQNVQARVRAERMWTWANSAGGLFLQTSNMSEKAVGYTTIGGDVEGALAVIANLPEDGRQLPARLPARDDRLGGHPPDAAQARRRAELRRGPGGREGAHAVPGARRLLRALRRREDGARRGGASALRAHVPRATTPARLDDWTAQVRAALHGSRSTSGCRRRSALHVGNLDLERERALQLPVVQRSEWQRRERMIVA